MTVGVAEIIIQYKLPKLLHAEQWNSIYNVGVKCDLLVNQPKSDMNVMCEIM